MMLILMPIMMLKFCVKESSNLIGLKNFGAVGLFKSLVFQKPNLPRPTPFLHQISALLLEVGDQRIKAKNGYKNFQQQSKSIFLGKIFCLQCTFLNIYIFIVLCILGKWIHSNFILNRDYYMQ